MSRTLLWYEHELQWFDSEPSLRIKLFTWFKWHLIYPTVNILLDLTMLIFSIPLWLVRPPGEDFWK